MIYPSPLKLPLGGKGVRPMSVDILPDEASERRQRGGGFKGEGYVVKPLY
ncbi:hypothetical protein [Candidatus Regiella insecticola]|nr:hypothetical protein [Candidatus Regiella insecticola]